jgi:thiol-disulfide isomerase/thioredoxin
MSFRLMAAVALATLPLLSLDSLPVLADDAPATVAANGVLKAGDAAPEVAVTKWVKGAPVKGFEQGKAYVVEFWATWCGPCIVGMPHLSELQRRYADQGLTVIGMTDPDPNNSLEQVEAMVAAKDDVMAYTVAWDESGQSDTRYMKAAKQNGIPTSFLVDKSGKIAFIGHPMWLDLPVAKVLDGTWDAVAGNAEIAEATKRLNAAFSLMRSDPGGALDAMEALVGEHGGVASLVENVRLSLTLGAGRYDDAFALAAKQVEQAVEEKDAVTLNAVAWALVDPAAKLEKRDLDLALEAAAAANALTGGKDAATLDTLARVYAWKGDLTKAIAIQEKAVALVKGTRMAEDLRATLLEYRAEQK